MKIIDRDHPFYKPLWRRIALVCVLAAWSLFETFVTRDPLWIPISIGLFAICVWQFLVTWPKSGPQSE